MTPSERLKEIEERLKSATPGPWGNYSWGGKCRISHEHDRIQCKYDMYKVDGDDFFGRYVSTEKCQTIVGANDYGPILNLPDAKFIAHSPTDIAWLIERVKELEEKIDQIESDAEDYRSLDK